MQSLRELYRIGIGPSSSHTMGPEKAAKIILERYKNAKKIEVILYGSLASTGKGHGTDRALQQVLGEDTVITFDMLTSDIKHPNTLDFLIHTDEDTNIVERVYSIGGGEIKFENEEYVAPVDVYSLNSFQEIKDYCNEKDIRLCDYVFQAEPDILEYLEEVWEHMCASIKAGLKATGILPGGLGVQRKAKVLFKQKHIDEAPETRESRMVCSYAFAVAEENAAGGVIATAPTCGACGVVPAVLYYMQQKHSFKDEQIIKALATAGLIGNLIKSNASISGAECGCQAEIGSACSMGAAGLAELFEMDIDQIEYAAEIAIEHHLGLTCDPIKGLVQIPCIERNAVAAMRSINCLNLANFLTHTRKISLDTIIQTMYETGKDLNRIYRETSEGGLAKLYKE